MSTPSTDDMDRAGQALRTLEACGAIVVDRDPETRAWVERMLAVDMGQARLAGFVSGWILGWLACLT